MRALVAEDHVALAVEPFPGVWAGRDSEQGRPAWLGLEAGERGCDGGDDARWTRQDPGQAPVTKLVLEVAGR